MQKPVEQDEVVEVGVALGFEDGLQVELHVGLAAQEGGLAQKPQEAAVGDDAPEMLGAVQELLHQGVGGEARTAGGIHPAQFPPR
ncbi:MAG: hypothetical protein V2G37_01340, partial [bacterium JZ-2024 1]